MPAQDKHRPNAQERTDGEHAEGPPPPAGEFGDLRQKPDRNDGDGKAHAHLKRMEAKLIGGFLGDEYR